MAIINAIISITNVAYPKGFLKNIYLFSKNFYLFIWLHRVLVVEGGFLSWGSRAP